MKKDIIAHIRENAGMTAEQADGAIHAVSSAITAVANRDGSARIPGFGTFKLKNRPERTARNPRTGEAVTVLARKVLTFKETKIGR